MKVIDAADHIYGRLSTKVAKMLLSGEEVVVVNAGKVVVTGSREFVLRKFRERMDIGSIRKRPHYPRTSNQILRRAIGDMLPKKKSTGMEKFKNCKVYSGVPHEYKDSEKMTIDEAKNTRMSRFVLLSEVAENLGGKY
jgi:large subunit ribosomal protein L13